MGGLYLFEHLHGLDFFSHAEFWEFNFVVDFDRTVEHGASEYCSLALNRKTMVHLDIIRSYQETQDSCPAKHGARVYCFLALNRTRMAHLDMNESCHKDILLMSR